MFQISYYLQQSGIYYVTLVNFSQTIVVMEDYFKKVMNVGNVVAGCREVDEETAKKLGFLIPVWTKKMTV